MVARGVISFFLPGEASTAAQGRQVPSRAVLCLQSKPDPFTAGGAWGFSITWAWPATPGLMVILTLNLPEFGSKGHPVLTCMGANGELPA